MNKTIFVFGNELLEKDSLIIRILPKLKKKFPEIDFVHIDPNEDLTELGENPIIIDVAEGIETPIILNDVNELITNQIHTMHDFDIAQNLKLMKKVGLIESIRIYAIPFNYTERKALNWLVKTLSVDFSINRTS